MRTILKCERYAAARHGVKVRARTADARRRAPAAAGVIRTRWRGTTRAGSRARPGRGSGRGQAAERAVGVVPGRLGGGDDRADGGGQGAAVVPAGGLGGGGAGGVAGGGGGGGVVEG